MFGSYRIEANKDTISSTECGMAWNGVDEIIGEPNTLLSLSSSSTLFWWSSGGEDIVRNNKITER